MNTWITKLILLVSLVHPVLMVSETLAQTYQIDEIGELDLDSDLITSNTVSRYFGMNVTGPGSARVRVTIGDVSFEDDVSIALASTQLYSYLFSGVLAENLGVKFRRGLFGTVTVELLDENGVSNDSATFELDVSRPKNACKKYPSEKIKTCTRVDLSQASLKSRRKVARKLAISIRGPIVLEP